MEEYIRGTKIISVGKDALSKCDLEDIPKLEKQLPYKVKEFIYYLLLHVFLPRRWGMCSIFR